MSNKKNSPQVAEATKPLKQENSAPVVGDESALQSGEDANATSSAAVSSDLPSSASPDGSAAAEEQRASDDAEPASDSLTDKTTDEAAQVHEYEVISPVNYNGKLYLVGDLIQLTMADASQLLDEVSPVI